MADYISREAVLEKAWDADTRAGYVQVVDVGDILEAPAADVVEVVHGGWQRVGIFKKEGPIYPCCSACGIVSAAYRSQWEGLQGPWRYCPNCGAKMDGGVYDATD